MKRTMLFSFLLKLYREKEYYFLWCQFGILWIFMCVMEERRLFFLLHFCVGLFFGFFNCEKVIYFFKITI